MNGKALYDIRDISADLSISHEEAEKLMEELRRRIEQDGLYAIKGYVPSAYYERQKAAGFLADAVGTGAFRVPLNEKRLLSIEEFCEYAGGIGTCTARKYARKIGIEVRIGGRCLVDRVKFDRWCDANTAAE